MWAYHFCSRRDKDLPHPWGLSSVLSSGTSTLGKELGVLGAGSGGFKLSAS